MARIASDTSRCSGFRSRRRMGIVFSRSTNGSTVIGKTTRRRRCRRSADLDVALKRPWSKQEFPILAKWVAANEKPMVLVVAGTRRPKRDDPLILGGGEDESLLKVCLPDTDQCRDFAPLPGCAGDASRQGG